MLQSSVRSRAGPEAITPRTKVPDHLPLAFYPKSNWCWPANNQVHHSKMNGWLIASNTGFKRFPFDNFTYCLTLFSKFFSSFPHGTCSLSVSRRYLALDELYHPFCAALPSNATLGTFLVRTEIQLINGILTLYDAPFQGTYNRSRTERTSPDYISTSCYTRGFQVWALPASLAVTGGILVSFFSSP